MLNPPLSLLSDDLLNYIVDHVAKVPFSDDLYNLSITDRAFTRFCQAYIFKDIYLGYGSRKFISKKLSNITNILDDEPSFANRVRTVHLAVAHRRSIFTRKWLLNNPNFITIIGLLAKSLMPPHKLHLTGLENSFIIEDPVLVVGWLMRSFFSQSLTVLDITDCRNVPLTLFLVCPNLREVYLLNVKVLESRDDQYPDLHGSGRELPALECLNYRNSGSLVKQMITPPSKFSMAVVNWSKLRVLVLYLQDEEGMVCLQPILDAACNTLEELYLTNLLTWDLVYDELSFAGFVDLRHLLNLHILEIHSLIRCDPCDVCGPLEPAVILDIEPVLSTIPEANQVTKLLIDLTVYCKHPFNVCLEEDWVGICDEIVRVSAGKPLQFVIEMMISPALGQDELNKRIDEMLAPLSDYPNICTNFRHPTFPT